MGVGGEICPNYVQNWELPLWFKVAIGMDGTFVDDQHDDLPRFTMIYLFNMVVVHSFATFNSQRVDIVMMVGNFVGATADLANGSHHGPLRSMMYRSDLVISIAMLVC